MYQLAEQVRAMHGLQVIPPVKECIAKEKPEGQIPEVTFSPRIVNIHFPVLPSEDRASTLAEHGTVASKSIILSDV